LTLLPLQQTVRLPQSSAIILEAYTTFGNNMIVSPVRAGDEVVISQSGTNTYGDGLFSNV
jgi:hypothetical protein